MEKETKEFLLGYLKKRQATELPCAELIDELLPMLSTADLHQQETWAKLLFYYISAQFVPDGPLYKYVIRNYAAIDSITRARKHHHCT